MKVAALALALFALCPTAAGAAPQSARPVPFFPKLSWGLSEQAALSQGLKTYKKQDAKAETIGLPSVTIGGIDFSAQVAFGKKDISEVRSGLNYIVLQHEGFVPRGKYDKFIRLIKGDFLYAGRSSDVTESAVFYNSIKRDNSLVVTSSDRSKIYLSVAIAPGLSK